MTRPRPPRPLTLVHRGPAAARTEREGRADRDGDPLADASDPALHRVLTLAFAPLHKRAFGIAVGTAALAGLVALTIADTLLDTGDRFPLGLLSAYLRGYDPTVAGTAIGAAWAFVIGFVAGWFAAFVRNLVLALAVALVRARVQWMETHDVLDHL